MVRQVKDPPLALQQLGSLLWHEFNPWLGNFHTNAMDIAPPKKKKKERKKENLHMYNGPQLKRSSSLTHLTGQVDIPGWQWLSSTW